MSDKLDTGVVYEGRRLVTEWWKTKERLERARRELQKAEEAARVAVDDLSGWLLPRDTQRGETIAIWFGDSLVQSTGSVWVEDRWLGPVELRTRGPKWDEYINNGR